jgi:phosphohistidine phosphatase
MLLYLLRHADAEEFAASDSERRLTEKGQAQALRVARFCEAHELLPGLVLTSPFVRAEQTARPVAEQTRSQLMVVDWLASGMSVETALAEMPAQDSLSSVMLVGHQPDLSFLMGNLLGSANAEQFSVSKASLAGLEVRRWRPGGAQLQFFLPCRLM